MISQIHLLCSVDSLDKNGPTPLTTVIEGIESNGSSVQHVVCLGPGPSAITPTLHFSIIYKDVLLP